MIRLPDISIIINATSTGKHHQRRGERLRIGQHSMGVHVGPADHLANNEGQEQQEERRLGTTDRVVVAIGR